MLAEWKQYRTLAELKAAYDSGELDKEKSRLIVDNWRVYVSAPYGTDGDWEQVFRSETILSDLLELVGIPWELA